MTERLPHPAYRPDIDGLRAIAVSAVVVFHIAPTLVPGGFSGVDVFFIISGYLISTILFSGLSNQTFNLGEFYSRRVRRIFPALIVVLLASFLFGWLVMVDREFRSLGKNIAGGAFFVSNIVLRNEEGYFDALADQKPLLHLWSLGIEEQFYIIWPMLLLVVYRLRIKALTPLLVLLVISFARNVHRVVDHPAEAFYLLPTRGWELLLGSLLALLVVEYRGRYKVLSMQISWFDRSNGPSFENLNNLLSCAGIVCLATAFWCLDKSKIFPGWWALPPTIGAVLLILAGPNAWINRKLLSHPVAIFLGKISFPLYLWHWPILYFVRLLEPDADIGLRNLVIVVLSVVLSWATYLFVEGKLRFSKKQLVPAMMGAMMFMIGITGYATFKGYIDPRNGSPAIRKITQAMAAWEFPASGKHGELMVGTSPHKVLFLGDSNVQQYWPRVDELVKNNTNSIRSGIFLTGPGCPPIPGVRVAANSGCTNIFSSLQKYEDDSAIETVVVAAAWDGYFSEGSPYFIEDVGTLSPNSKGSDAAFASLSEMLGRFRTKNKKIFLILQIPYGRGLDPQSLLVRHILAGVQIDLGGESRSVIVRKRDQITSKLRDVALKNGAEIIDPLDYLCTSSNCPAVLPDGDPVYKDGSHLSSSFVRTEAKFIDKTMLP